MDETEAWIAFLEGKGTLHLIAEIGEEPQQYSDLEERLRLSSSTLSARLKEGVRLDAFRLERTVDEDGDRQVYGLKRAGEDVYNVMERHDAVTASREARELLAVVDEVEQLLVQRIEDAE